MLKYVDAQVVFREIPDEITLAISISNCPNNCDGCHSPHLKDDIGEPLNIEALHTMLFENKGITCICFMGGNSDMMYLETLCKYIKDNFPEIKTAWYSGRYEITYSLLDVLDYWKAGPYIKEKGGLDNPNTNQRLYKVKDRNREDITFKFWKNETKD